MLKQLEHTRTHIWGISIAKGKWERGLHGIMFINISGKEFTKNGPLIRFAHQEIPFFKIYF